MSSGHNLTIHRLPLNNTRAYHCLSAPQRIKSIIVRPLSQDFLDYLIADGVFMPDGAEDMSVSSFDDTWSPNIEHGVVQQKVPVR